MKTDEHENRYGCPFIRICPYMTDERRGRAEEGRFIRQPVTAYLEDMEDGRFVSMATCEYGQECSYPSTVVRELAQVRVSNGITATLTCLSGLLEKLSSSVTSGNIGLRQTLDHIDQQVGFVLSSVRSSAGKSK